MPLWIISLIGQVLVPLLTHIYDSAKAAPMGEMTEAQQTQHEANLACLGEACQHIQNIKI